MQAVGAHTQDGTGAPNNASGTQWQAALLLGHPPPLALFVIPYLLMHQFNVMVPQACTQLHSHTITLELSHRSHSCKQGTRKLSTKTTRTQIQTLWFLGSPSLELKFGRQHLMLPAANTTAPPPTHLREQFEKSNGSTQFTHTHARTRTHTHTRTRTRTRTHAHTHTHTHTYTHGQNT